MEKLKTHEAKTWRWSKILAGIALFSLLSANENISANNDNFYSNQKSTEISDVLTFPKDSVKIFADGSVWTWKFDSETWNLIKWKYTTKDNATYEWTFDPNIQWGLIRWTKTSFDKNVWFLKIWNTLYGYNIQEWKFDPKCWYLVDWKVKIWATIYAIIKWWEYDENWKLINWKITFNDWHKESGKFDPLTWKLSTGKIVRFDDSNIKITRLENAKYDTTTWNMISWKISDEIWSREWVFDAETWKLIKWVCTNYDWTIIDNGEFDLQTWILIKGTRFQNGTLIEFDLQALWEGKYEWKIQRPDGSFFMWVFKWRNLEEWTISDIYRATKIWKFRRNLLVEWKKIYPNWSEENWKFKIMNMANWDYEILWDGTKTDNKWNVTTIKNWKKVKDL